MKTLTKMVSVANRVEHSSSGAVRGSVDAEYLARLARLDPKLLAPIQHRPINDQAAMAVIRPVRPAAMLTAIHWLFYDKQ